MEKFNEMIEGILNGTPAPDTDSEVGNYGALDASGAEANTKIIIHLDSGVELHLPLEVVEQITTAVNGPVTPDVPEVPEVAETSDDEESDDDEESEDEESEEKESDDDDESEDDDDDKKKDTALSEGCGKKHAKKKMKKMKKYKGVK